MPEAVTYIRAMLQRGIPVDEPFQQRVAAAMAIPVEPLLRFVGLPLRELHQAAICGGLAFTLTGGVEPVRAIVPMSFQSALVGIMLAAEMVTRLDTPPFSDHRHPVSRIAPRFGKIGWS